MIPIMDFQRRSQQGLSSSDAAPAWFDARFHNSLWVVCSSFDEYSTEVKSGRLEWSPVHKSERFWRENAAILNEKNYELLKYVNQSSR